MLTELTIMYMGDVWFTNYHLSYCREHSEVTLHFTPFFFNGIPMFLIRLTWGFLLQEGGGREKQLLDGYIYPDSDFTEWKLVVPNVFISNFMTIPSSLIFLRPLLVLDVKVRLPRLKEKP